MMEEHPTVLVVDDDLDIRECLEVLLPRFGFDVATAADGAEALSWLRRGQARPCVVLLDLMMPGMDGVQFHEQLTADPALANIPVVVATGAGAVALEQAATMHVEVLRKPFDLMELVTIMRRFSQPPPQ
jgi:CheY-like chemotaxis protein